ncbi:hypothetical protein DP1340 [Desulfotalea psychrophila LSv54]|uniref:UspA domain-containing protein n=2 Tax=Desulfotalea psychrophila TaxID=84980 RepID=Q6ANK5_DESPS|nr:hypothetical protein DP1340 [Desulfotalea psychrophila LSv54]
MLINNNNYKWRPVMSIIRNVDCVVTPIDFSDNSEMIAKSAAYMAGKFGASLHLVFVVQNFEDYSGFFVPQMSMPSLENELLEGAMKKMEAFCEKLQPTLDESGISDVKSKVLTGDVAERIIEYAAGADAGMIIMGTHGYKGLEKIMFGSVAGKVVRAAGCPVLTINPYKCSMKE